MTFLSLLTPCQINHQLCVGLPHGSRIASVLNSLLLVYGVLGGFVFRESAPEDSPAVVVAQTLVARLSSGAHKAS
jgi:hypothetical protein